MKTIDANELKRFIAGEPRGAVINVLDPDYFEAKHIPGSVNIPLSTPDFEERVNSQVHDKNKPVVVYCASTECDASEQAAEKLERAGFSDVRDYAPGVAGWEEDGRELRGSETARAQS